MKISRINLHPKKCCEDKYYDFLLIGEESKTHYVLIKDLNAFLYDLHQIVEENTSAVIVYKLLEQQKNRNVMLKIANGKQKINMLKKDEYVRFKNYEKKQSQHF